MTARAKEEDERLAKVRAEPNGPEIIHEFSSLLDEGYSKAEIMKIVQRDAPIEVSSHRVEMVLNALVRERKHREAGTNQ